jgi:hypothetical protein
MAKTGGRRHALRASLRHLLKLWLGWLGPGVLYRSHHQGSASSKGVSLSTRLLRSASSPGRQHVPAPYTAHWDRNQAATRRPAGHRCHHLPGPCHAQMCCALTAGPPQRTGLTGARPRTHTVPRKNKLELFRKPFVITVVVLTTILQYPTYVDPDERHDFTA